jgi:hypothetical protein
VADSITPLLPSDTNVDVPIRGHPGHVRRTGSYLVAFDCRRKGPTIKRAAVAVTAPAVGFESAQDRIGLMYYNGKGVLRDFAEAARWYQLAAQGESIVRNCNSPIYTREASVFPGTSQSRKNGHE